MLIYNFQKEFLGIDEEDLNALGFSNLQELRAESADFADMFVKTPGHVHNFAHVHWIDFVMCADFHEDSKVIIHAHNKNYKCTIEAKTAYLVDNPSQKAYLIYLSNIHELSAKEGEQISKDIYDKPIPVSTTASNPIFDTPEFDDSFASNQQNTQDNDLAVIDEYDTYQEPVTLKKEPLNPNVVEDSFIEENSFVEEQTVEPILNDEDLLTNDEYEYDPEVASKALGLPVDLIEEFLQDFIAQSKEFEPELYDSLEKDNLSNVKILSHKLKGVAANLRVEDAYDALTIINSTDDYHEIKANLVTFYKIISKLAGDTTEVTKEKPLEPAPKKEETPVASKTNISQTEEEEFVIDFKDDSAKEEDILDDTLEDDISYIEDEPLEFKDDPLEMKFNKNLAASEIGIDIQSYNELLKDFIQENLTSIESINKAIDEEDFQMWKKHAIKLKGMSDNMRINLFMQELETIIDTEDTATAKKSIHDIATKLTQISVVEA